MSELPPTAAPHRLGRYYLHTRLAVGGMAEVWLARQEGPAGFSKELVVKKILPHLAADRQFVEMFLNEARLAARLNHPNVVQIFELGEDNGSYFLVMEFIDGRNLRSMQRHALEHSEHLPLGLLCHALAGACEGLHYAHELKDAAGQSLNIVHRDISPDNILLSFDGQPKVVDFGIAKAATNASTTKTGTLKGKYSYMPPEQVSGLPVDRRGDVYAVGVVLYELIAGARPFRSTSELALLKSILYEEPPTLESQREDVPAELVSIVKTAMAKNLAARYQDARSLGRELDAFARTHQPTGPSDAASFMEQRYGAERETLRATLSAVAIPVRAPPPVPIGAVLAEAKAASSPRRPWLLPLALVAAAVSLVVATAAVVRLATLPLDPAIAPPPPLATAAPDAAPSVPGPGKAEPSVAVGEPARPPEPDKPAEPAKPADQGNPPEAKKPAAGTRPVARGNGKIVVRVNPWAEVSLDGRRLGVTPLPPIEATEGRHVLVFENGEIGKTKALKVDVRAGKESVVRVDLLD